MLNNQENQNTTEPEPYPFCSLQGELNYEFVKLVHLAGQNINKEDLYYAEPLPHDVHITTLRGLLPDKDYNFKKILPSYKISGAVNKLSFLSPPNKDYDILTLDIESKKLRELNAYLCEELKVIEDYDFLPHISVAFLKKMRPTKYLDLTFANFLINQSFEILEYQITDTNGNAEPILR